MPSSHKPNTTLPAFTPVPPLLLASSASADIRPLG